MATPAGRALTLAHQSAQQTLSAQVVADLVHLWPLIDWTRYAETYPLWLEQIASLVERGRATSSALAAAYLRLYRQAEGVAGAAPIVLADPASQEWINTSMKVTAGNAVAAASYSGQIAAKALVDNAFVRSSGAVQRIVAQAGRITIDNTVRADDKALGYARIIHGKTCAFCAMLATRGPVYKSDTVGFDAHDHCDCTGEPIYGAYDPQPEVVALQDLYASATHGVHGTKNAIHAFAKAYYAAP